MSDSFRDHFSGHAADYARFRPDYPEALFSYLASLAPARRLAWDCATGSGQAAAGLAPRFEEVVATDASAPQIEQAPPIPRVRYAVSPAESATLPDGSVDLVTVAQALHWFDLPSFFAEVRRVLVPGGVVAVWCYDLLSIASDIDPIVNRFYRDVVGEYWPKERSIVERGYGSLEFPFEEVEIPPPGFTMEKEWTLPDLLGYVRTWSAVRRFMAARGEDPVLALERSSRRPGDRPAGPGAPSGTSTCGSAGNARIPFVPLSDSLGRPLSNLRVSVTDRCNLRCQYCMPERDYVWLPRSDVLDFEEIARLVEVFTSAGVDRVRLTGGEPLVRRDLPRLVELLAGNAAIRDLAITTNGVLLEEQAEALKAAGLHRVTVSLDTLRRDRFEALTRFDAHERVLAGISAAARTGMRDLKIDSVVMRGVNDDELVPLLEYGRDVGAEVRFIEYMDVGGATHWSPERVVSRREILEAVEERYGAPEPLREGSSAPAERFRLARRHGVRRHRVDDGALLPVLRPQPADRGRALVPLSLRDAGRRSPRPPSRRRLPEELRAILAAAWNVRDDRGAETRLALAGRAPLLPLAELRRDPHLEMHTRGG